jgi:class 3 adenylate cyclase
MPADAAATPSSSVSTLQQRIDELSVELRARTAERDEAMQRERALAEVFQVINSSPGDLAPVFDAMLEKATELCGAEFGCLFLYDGQAFTVVADRNLPSAYAQKVRGQPFSAKTNSVLRNMVENKAPVHVTNMFDAAYSRREPLRTLTLELGGVRSLITVPLLNKARLIGFFSIYKGESGGFAEDQIALVSTFANQAVIAIENTRLITEIREALEQQTAAADMLGIINSSPGDLAPVIDTMLEKATRLCEAAYGVLWTYDGHSFHGAAARGVPSELVAFLREPQTTEPGTGIGRLLAGEPYMHWEDLKESEAYRSISPIARAVADLGGARSNLMVPLRSDAAFLGAISVFRKEVRPFSDKQIALLQTFAAQAVIAMENARLITEQHEALERQTATAEVLQVINSSPGNLVPVFDAMLEKAMRLCGAVCGALFIYDGQHFRVVATRGVPQALAEYRAKEPPTPATNDRMRQNLETRRYVQVVDVTQTDAYRSGDPGDRAMADLGGARTILNVPLLKDDAVVGNFSVYRQEPRAFSDKQIALLENFAAQAVIAMENARLLGELRERTDQVAELNRGLEARVAEQVEELGRVGRLKRFLAPQLAELIVSQGDEKILESHRREIVVVFCDLRGYTAFAEAAEPEEVLDFLREYHGALGPLVSQFEGTLDQFSGDGIMVFFNDPVPIPDPAERAVKMAVAMREAASSLTAAWRERGRELGFGAGIAQGYATLGQIGFSERSGYTAIGTVCNVAARLCGEAKDGQILLSQRVNVALKGSVATEQVGALVLKGLTQPVVAYNVPPTASQTALRVIDEGNH